MSEYSLIPTGYGDFDLLVGGVGLRNLCLAPAGQLFVTYGCTLPELRKVVSIMESLEKLDVPTDSN